MADEKQADWDAAVASNNVPWFLTAWFDATARGRAAAESAATTAVATAAGGKAPAASAPGGEHTHPAHPAPCLRVFTSLIRAGVCQADAGEAIAKMGVEE
jgi:hypothetical protein